MERDSKVGSQKEAAVKEKLYIRLGRAAFVLRYEQWQRHEAARAALSQSPAQQHVDDRELRSKEEDGFRDY